MAEDKRELILDRLFTVYQEVAGEKFAFRNRTDVPEKARPAIILLDADETTDESSYGKGRPANGPVIVGLTPETYLLVEGKSDSSAKADEKKVGAEINALRIKVLKAVLHDASLVALCKDGEIRYDGFSTGLAAGRTMEGEASLSLTFRYVLRPDRL